MKLRLSHIFLLLISTILVSCEKEPSPNFHVEYFGMEKGRYVIYDVVDITHDKDIAVHDTLHYQLMTKWGAVYIDNENREGREFLRYVRSSPSENWKLIDTWHGVIDGIRAELIEENQRKVKLVFSPTYSKSWNMNASNLDEEIWCYYRDIHGDTILNGLFLDSTLVVETDLIPNQINDERAYEVYAKGIGLVYKYYKKNRYFNFGDPEVGEGKELYYTYSSSGSE